MAISAAMPSPEIQELAERFNINSVQVSREFHNARNAIEITVHFRDSENSKHRVDVWITNLQAMDAEIKRLVFEAVRKELENEQQ